MRANSSLRFVEINKQATENNLDIRQQLLWVNKYFLMRPLNTWNLKLI